MNQTYPELNVPPPPPLFGYRERILFQGDSITDMGRGRTEDSNHLLGHGYAFIVSAWEGANFPERRLTFLNRGISGNTSADLAARLNPDALELDPGVLSILIGVNDVNQALRAELSFSVDEYAERYDSILSAAVGALPRVRLILGEPFFAPGVATLPKIDQWQQLMPELRAALAGVAKKFGVPIVRYQAMFDEAAKRAPIEYWIWDGIHPTFAGHQLMADLWRQTYRTFYGEPGNDQAKMP